MSALPPLIAGLIVRIELSARLPDAFAEVGRDRLLTPGVRFGTRQERPLLARDRVGFVEQGSQSPPRARRTQVHRHRQTC